jgi:hypothetical protein
VKNYFVWIVDPDQNIQNRRNLNNIFIWIFPILGKIRDIQTQIDEIQIKNQYRSNKTCFYNFYCLGFADFEYFGLGLLSKQKLFLDFTDICLDFSDSSENLE